jgi:hypothetical protein
MLDTRTVQHHGDNLFPLALRLAKADLAQGDESRVVFQNAFGHWFQWPASWPPFLLVLIAMALAVASRRSQR